jgi:hypothetical protein
MTEEIQKIQYQWTKGEKASTIETLQEERIEKNIPWLYFESGNRINKNLLLDYMIELLPGQNAMRNVLDVSEINTDPDKIPERRPTSNADMLGSADTNFKKSTVKHSDKSPIRELLEKASKVKNAERNISLKFKVFYPKKTTYNILKESFGSDVKKEIVDHIYDQIINESFFKKELSKTIKDLVNSTYDSKK